VAKFTVAVTPSSLFSFRSMRAAHEAQVIPPTESSTLRTTDSAAAAVTRLMVVLTAMVFLPHPPGPGRGWRWRSLTASPQERASR
jgi:hypothetical protein